MIVHMGRPSQKGGNPSRIAPFGWVKRLKLAFHGGVKADKALEHVDPEHF